MRRRLLDLLACPACKGSLKLEVFQEAGTEILDGLFRCSCGLTYPIIDGIPRFAIRSLHEYAGWSKKYQEILSGVKMQLPADTPFQDPKTVESFGFEWTLHSQPYSREKLKLVVLDQCKLAPDYFQGKLVLDAGCGAGQQTRFIAELGAEVVGLDLSDAALIAYRNNRDMQAVHIVQADLSHPPFRERTFDFVYSEGVLHHTADPCRSLRTLVGLVKVGGQITAGFYWQREGFSPALFVKNLIRRFLSLFPKRVTYYLCWFSIPLSKMPVLKKFFARYLILYDPNNPDDRFTWCLNYDWYGKHRYQYSFTRKEVASWFHDETLHLTDIVEGKPNFYRATVKG
ncbi:MAG: methyltransferase domain-containing protein [Candidatus Methylomirabilales bacterium]